MAIGPMETQAFKSVRTRDFDNGAVRDEIGAALRERDTLRAENARLREEDERLRQQPTESKGQFMECGICGTEHDPNLKCVCEHGTALDSHCCNCHSGLVSINMQHAGNCPSYEGPMDQGYEGKMQQPTREATAEEQAVTEKLKQRVVELSKQAEDRQREAFEAPLRAQVSRLTAGLARLSAHALAEWPTHEWYCRVCMQHGKPNEATIPHTSACPLADPDHAHSLALWLAYEELAAAVSDCRKCHHDDGSHWSRVWTAHDAVTALKVGKGEG